MSFVKHPSFFSVIHRFLLCNTVFLLYTYIFNTYIHTFFCSNWWIGKNCYSVDLQKISITEFIGLSQYFFKQDIQNLVSLTLTWILFWYWTKSHTQGTKPCLHACWLFKNCKLGINNWKRNYELFFQLSKLNKVRKTTDNIQNTYT